MIEIKLKNNVVFIDTDCVVCGKEFALDLITVELYESGVIAGEICPECLEGGTAAIREHFKNHANDLIKRSETIAEELLADAKQYQEYSEAEITCPDYAEFVKALKEAEIRYMEAVNDGDR